LQTDLSCLIRTKLQLIIEIDRLHDHADQMIAVFPLSLHIQTQIDLGIGLFTNPHRTPLLLPP